MNNNTIRIGFAITIGLLGILAMLFGVIFGNFWQSIAGVWMMIVGSDAFAKSKDDKAATEAKAEMSLLDIRLRGLEREYYSEVKSNRK